MVKIVLEKSWTVRLDPRPEFLNTSWSTVDRPPRDVLRKHVVGKGSLKKREVGKSEVGKFHLSWQVSIEVGKFLMHY